ncbi:condensin-2 complex subunit D3-L-like isoform X2 [Rhopilema esculentum]|uniref:condensin-2 complex subunit D3-L-like isoform X2 n=1 Tax=Rhopilema esculentum TaxID=499914 RepID=UPI0031E3155E
MAHETCYNKTIDLLQQLKIPDVENQWIDEAISANFCEIDGLPEPLREEAKMTKYFVEQLKDIRDISPTWGEMNELKTFWSWLPENEMSNKALLAILACFITSKTKVSSVSWRDLSCIYASNIYLHLVSIPGSVAHGILNQILLAKAIENLKRWPRGDKAPTKRKKTQKSNPRGAKARRGSGRTASQRNAESSRSDEEEDMDVSIEQPNEVGASSPEVEVSMKEAVLDLLKDTTSFIKRNSFKDLQQALYSCIQVFAHLTRLECIHDTFRHAGKCIKDLAYEAIESFCSEFHDDVSKISRCVMNYCLSSIMMFEDEKPVQALTIPKQLQNIKNDTRDFICNLIKKNDPAIVQSVRVLLQNMCVKIPDKAAYRNILCTDICKIILCFPVNIQETITEWFKKYSRNAKIGYRVFSIDLMNCFLLLPEEDIVGQEGQRSTCRTAFLQAMFARCSDRSPTVRAKALTCLHQVASSPCESVILTFKDLLSSSVNPSGLFQTQNLSKDVVSDSRGSDRVTILDLIRRRMKDERVLVRKAAIQAFNSVLLLLDMPVAVEDLKLLFERGMDPALSVRKQVMHSMTQLLQHFSTNPQLQKFWLNCVLPMVLDRETTAQEQCVGVLEELILSKIRPSDKSYDSDHILAWTLLDNIAGNEGQESSQYFGLVCENWSKNGKINGNLVKSLQTHLNTNNAKAAWLFIAAVSSSSDKINPSIITDYWFKNIEDNSCQDVMTMSRILKTILTISKKLSPDLATKLLDDIQERVIKFRCPPELISLCVQCLPKLYSHVENGEAKLQDVCEKVLAICEEDISQSILGTEHAIPIDKSEIIKRLVTLGDIAQLGPSKTSERMFVMVQSMLLPQPSSGGSTGVNENSIRNLIISTTVKAYAFGTLGKLCLQNDGLAKKCVAALARELETSEDPAIKNNVIVALCDLCVRYTNLVDRYIPNIASCLADPEPVVRRQALTLLTHLLQEDFVKWKGSLFFRFITALADENKEIKNFAEFCLVHILLPRHPTMFSVHFIETLFCFNSYTKHRAYNKFQQTELERTRFSLAGDSKREKRMQIYTFLLGNMNDEQKFKLTGKICNEIFGEIVDGTMAIDAQSKPMIEDAFAIISSQEIKISKGRSSAEPEEGMDEEQQELASQLRAKVISQIVKKNMIENIFPTIISLKKQFEKEKSSLLRDLMQCLKELMSDYKAEIRDILALDKQLAAEIEYDLKKYEERQRETVIPEQIPMTPGRNVPQSHASASRNHQRTPLATMQQDHPMTASRRNAAITPRNGAAFSSPRLKTPTNANNPSRSAYLAQTAPVHMKTPKSKAKMNQTTLSTAVLLNSAKKVMEKMRKLSVAERASVPSPRENVQEKDQVGTPRHDRQSAKGIIDENNVTPKAASSAGNATDIVTPKVREIVQDQLPDFRSPVQVTDAELMEDRVGRAISTPEGHLSHISFMAPTDLSFIPRVQSPVPIKIQRRSRKAGMQGGTKKPEDDRIICMPSPHKPSEKPSQWNVQSPARWDGPQNAMPHANRTRRKNK